MNLRLQKNKRSPYFSGSAGLGLQLYRSLSLVPLPQNSSDTVLATFNLQFQAAGCYNSINESLLCPDTFALNATSLTLLSATRGILLVDIIVSIHLEDTTIASFERVSLDVAPRCNSTASKFGHILDIPASTVAGGTWEGVLHDVPSENLTDLWHLYVTSPHRDIRYSLSVTVMKPALRNVAPSSTPLLSIVPVHWWIWAFMAALICALGSWVILWCFMKREKKNKREELARLAAPVPEETPVLE